MLPSRLGETELRSGSAGTCRNNKHIIFVILPLIGLFAILLAQILHPPFYGSEAQRIASNMGGERAGKSMAGRSLTRTKTDS